MVSWLNNGSGARGARRGPLHKALLSLPFVFFVVLISYYVCYRDPTSLFFIPSLAYKPGYSAFRQVQAAAYIVSANEEPQLKTDSGRVPALCVGIPSVARAGPRYFRDTVGSILEGLDRLERGRIHLILFLAHTNQSAHPAFGEPWVHNVADTVLKYTLPPIKMQHIKEMELEKGLFREKGLFDYRYLLKACQDTRADHIVMVEDDTLAMDGWYHRTMDAIRVAEQKTKAMNASRFLYLRLFFTEEYFGWNTEEWRNYLKFAIEVWAVEIVALLLLRRAFRSDRVMKPYFSDGLLSVYAGLAPVLILFFFSLGRITIFPLGRGVVEMPRFGCCSQALLFPRGRVPEVMNLLETTKSGFVDEALENYANKHDEIRWALIPSVFQHVGAKSSKGDGTVIEEDMRHNRPLTEAIFNFEFETQDPAALHEEHLQAQ